jgi:predicted nucleic acid-binding protein
MSVLPDTPVWSLAFRRAGDPSDPRRVELTRLVGQGAVELIGPVRQELLSGIREPKQFEQLRDQLRSFPDVPLLGEDFEQAAAFSNRCRAKGVQGSAVDFLLCAVAVRRELSIFTTDLDFEGYRRHLPIRLHAPTGH